MSAEITYLDMELYLNYSILISNSVPTFIISICDNLIKCNKLIQNNKISYMYRIPIYKLESGINLELNSDTNYKKYYNNDDFVIPKNIDCNIAKNKDTLYYIVYLIQNKQIFPIKISRNLIEVWKYMNSKLQNNIYIVGLKNNKVYNSIYEYEYLSVNV